MNDCPYRYKYDEQYALAVAIRAMLENLVYAQGKILKPEQITAIFQDAGNQPSLYPRVAVYLRDTGYLGYTPEALEVDSNGEWELWKDAEFAALLVVEVKGDNPVEVSYLMNAIKHKLLDSTRKGTYSRTIPVEGYIQGKTVLAKLLLKRPEYLQDERHVVTKDCRGYLIGDITMPVLTIHSSIPMVPELQIEVDDVAVVIPDPNA